MGNALGKDKPLKEVLRENKRMINRAVRELEREKAGLEREEKRLTMEIKKAARENQMKSVRIMAKDLVRTRQHITKFIEMKSHLQGTGLKLQTVKSHQAMAEAMKNTAKAMAKMNKAVDAKTISKMMAEFERENMRTELMQEIMGDAIDDALADDEAEEEQEKIVNQVLDEIGVTFGEGTFCMTSTTMLNKNYAQTELPQASGFSSPAGRVEVKPGQVAIGGDDPQVSELEARLNNLKR